MTCHRLISLGVAAIFSLPFVLSPGKGQTLSPSPAPTTGTLPSDPMALAQLNQEFLQAVRDGDITKVGEYIDRGINLNSYKTRETALYVATTLQNAEMVRYLLSRGAQADFPVADRDTPLSRACFLGNKEIAEMLCQGGAKLDPVLYATGVGDIAFFEKWKADGKLNLGVLQVALWHASAANDPAMFNWLWNELSNLSGKRSQKSFLEACYIVAAQWGHVETLQRLEELGVEVQKPGPKALHTAVVLGRQPIVEHLVSLGIVPQFELDDYGNMALMRGLLAAGAKPDTNSLRLAVKTGNLEMFKMLAASGDAVKRLSLIVPVDYGNTDVLQVMLDKGANPNASADFNYSALVSALAHNDTKSLKLLLKYGADPTAADVHGETPLSLARQQATHKALVPILENAVEEWNAQHPLLDLKQEIARADAIFTISFLPSRTPTVQVEKTLFQNDSPQGQVATSRGTSALQERFIMTTVERSELVFARMPRGDSNYFPYAIVAIYPLTKDSFTIAGKMHTLDELEALLKH